MSPLFQLRQEDQSSTTCWLHIASTLAGSAYAISIVSQIADRLLGIERDYGLKQGLVIWDLQRETEGSMEVNRVLLERVVSCS